MTRRSSGTIQEVRLHAHGMRAVCTCLCGLNLVTAALLYPCVAGIKEDWAKLSGGKGGKLAYTKPAGSNQKGKGLYVMTLSSGTEHKIADIDFPESRYGLAGSIQWSYNGKKISLQTTRGVYVLNEDGSQFKTIWTGTISNGGGAAVDLISHMWSSDNEIVYSVGKKIVKTTLDNNNSKIRTQDVVGSAPKGYGYISVGMSGNFVSYIDGEANKGSGGWHRPMVINISNGEKWKMVADNSDGCQLRLKPDGTGTVMWCHGDHSKLLVNRFKSGPIHTYKPFSGGIQEPNWSNDDGFFVHMGGRTDPSGAWIRKSKSDDNVNLGGSILLPDLYVGGEAQPPDNTPPSAPSNLSATAAGKSQIDLSWDAASDGESGVGSYTIYRDGNKIGTSTTTSYSDKNLNEGTTYKYKVSAVNGENMEGDKSNEASATTEADNDTSPPDVSSVIAQSATSVKVTFTEPVTKESVEKTGNYEISGGVGISKAALQGDNKSVVLTTSTLTEKTTYTLTASNITDRSPNANKGGGRKQFTLSGDVQISSLTVASGKSYEIVESIAEGDKQYIDRDYTFSSLGDCAGMYYIRTANEDKEESGDSFLSFDINRGATVLVAYRHGSDLPSWLSSWSKTGDQVCGDGCSDVYEKDFNGGSVTLGGNRPGGAGNMYGVFIDAGGHATIFVSNVQRSSILQADVRLQSIGNNLSVSGLHPRQVYTITLTDASGRISCLQRTTDSRGMVPLSTANPLRGVYVVSIAGPNARHSIRAVFP